MGLFDIIFNSDAHCVQQLWRKLESVPSKILLKHPNNTLNPPGEWCLDEICQSQSNTIATGKFAVCSVMNMPNNKKYIMYSANEKDTKKIQSLMVWIEWHFTNSCECIRYRIESFAILVRFLSFLLWKTIVRYRVSECNFTHVSMNSTNFTLVRNLYLYAVYDDEIICILLTKSFTLFKWLHNQNFSTLFSTVGMSQLLMDK